MTTPRCRVTDLRNAFESSTSMAAQCHKYPDDPATMAEAVRWDRKAARAAAQLPIAEARAAAHEALMSAQRVARGQAP